MHFELQSADGPLVEADPTTTPGHVWLEIDGAGVKLTVEEAAEIAAALITRPELKAVAA